MSEDMVQMRFVGKTFYAPPEKRGQPRRQVMNGDLVKISRKQYESFKDQFEDPAVLERQVEESRSKAREAAQREEAERQARREAQAAEQALREGGEEATEKPEPTNPSPNPSQQATKPQGQK